MIVDANVVISAVLGRSLPLVRSMVDRGFDLFIPAEQFREVNLVTMTEAMRQKRDVTQALSQVVELLLPVETGYYAAHEQAARVRLSRTERAQKDWSLLALAMTSGDAIWTNDRDLFGTGVITWTTLNILFAQITRLPPDSIEDHDA